MCVNTVFLKYSELFLTLLCLFWPLEDASCYSSLSSKFPQLRHVPSNLLLASLAVCDLLLGILTQPLYAASCVCALTRENCSFILPTLITYAANVLGYSSLVSITLITIDRYICIVESLRYHTIVTKTRALQAVIISWVICTVLPVIGFIPSISTTVIRAIPIIMISLGLVFNIFSYWKIIRISEYHRRNIISQLQAVTQGPIQREFQSAKSGFLVVGTVILSYVPILLTRFLLNVNIENNQVEVFHPFAVTLYLVNASVNPLILFFRSRNLRRFLKKIFKRNIST